MHYCFGSVVSSEIIFSQENPANFPVSELSQRQLRFRAMEQRALRIVRKIKQNDRDKNPLNSLIVAQLWNPFPWKQMLRTPTTHCPGPMVDPLPLPVEEPVEQESAQF